MGEQKRLKSNNQLECHKIFGGGSGHCYGTSDQKQVEFNNQMEFRRESQCIWMVHRAAEIANTNFFTNTNKNTNTVTNANAHGWFPGGIQVHRAAEIAELRRKMETKQHPRIVEAYWHKFSLNHNF